MTPHAHAPLPLWLWQVVLLGGGVALACAPLADLLRGRVAAERAPQPSAMFATMPSTPPTATTPA